MSHRGLVQLTELVRGIIAALSSGKGPHLRQRFIQLEFSLKVISRKVRRVYFASTYGNH